MGASPPIDLHGANIGRLAPCRYDAPATLRYFAERNTTVYSISPPLNNVGVEFCAGAVEPVRRFG